MKVIKKVYKYFREKNPYLKIYERRQSEKDIRISRDGRRRL